MDRRTVAQAVTAVALVAGGAVICAQALLPSVPPKKFGGSITPVYEGWFDNPDGTHTFLIGYFSRNTEAEIDVPIGPNNRFEPGNPDMGQPTHFLPSRRYGMFTVTVPKEFTPQQKISWSLTVSGVTTSIPFYMSPDYNITPSQSSEEATDGGYNLPPILRFDPAGPAFPGPVATPLKAVLRTASVAKPMSLDIWADDDAKHTSGSGTPLRTAPPPVTLTVSKYRGPGTVTFSDTRPKMETLKGGKLGEPYSGKASTSVTFGEPGEYMIHVTANDYSGNGGGGFACCWTTGLVRVTVKGAGPVPTGGQ